MWRYVGDFIVKSCILQWSFTNGVSQMEFHKRSFTNSVSQMKLHNELKYHISFIVVTMTHATIYEAKETSYRLTVLLGCYLFCKRVVYYFLLSTLIQRLFRKLPFVFVAKWLDIRVWVNVKLNTKTNKREEKKKFCNSWKVEIKQCFVFATII